MNILCGVKSQVALVSQKLTKNWPIRKISPGFNRFVLQNNLPTPDLNHSKI